MDDERRIAFFALRIGQVIMDAVAVEGQRGIAEEQRFLRRKAALPLPAGQVRRSGRS